MYSFATLAGSYAIVGYAKQDAPVESQSMFGTLTLNANGSYIITFSGNTNRSTTDIQATINGTYTVASDGTLTFTSPGETDHGFVTANGTIYIGHDGDQTSEEMYVAAKLGSGVTLASTAGSYAMVGYANQDAPAEAQSMFGTLTLNANATFSATFTGNTNLSSTDIQATTTGTYTVASNGALSLTNQFGTNHGYVTANGTILMGHDGDQTSEEIYVAAKLTSSATVATTAGSYAIVGYAHQDGPVESQSLLGTLTLNGNSTYSMTFTGNTNLSTTNMQGTVTGTYTVASNGLMTLTNQFGTNHAYLTANGTILAGHDGDQTSEEIYIASPLSRFADVMSYSWKAHTLLNGLTVSDGTHNGATDANGALSLTGITDAALTITAARAVPTAEATATADAVNLQDAIAILKMIVGLNVNGANQPLSPYQAFAADYDSNGIVNLNDAIGVLKHVVGLAAPQPEWIFFNETDASIPSKANLNPGTVPALTADMFGSSRIHVGLTAVLRGDVDGSFAGAPGAADLDAVNNPYFVLHGLNLAQFGIYI